MRNKFKKFNAVFLLLLLAGSFFLHIPSHGCGCSALCTGNAFENLKYALLHNGGNSFLVTPGSGISKAELFCPVCVGMLTADCPASSGTVLRRSPATVIPAANSAEITFPRRLLPSPRAPPSACI